MEARILNNSPEGKWILEVPCYIENCCWREEEGTEVPRLPGAKIFFSERLPEIP